VADCRTALGLLAEIGVDVSRSSRGATLRAAAVRGTEAPADLVRTMRASFLVLGPLLARFGEARVATPGGCAIGRRPVDLHLAGLARMGASIRAEDGFVHARAAEGCLRGARIRLPFPSVGATENLMLAASLARGTSVIENAAREPEVVDLAEALGRMGAAIRGAGSGRIEIEGRKRLGGLSHRVIPDRIEAGTFLMAAAAAGGEATIERARPEHLGAAVAALREAGVEVEELEGALRVRRFGPLRPLSLSTAPYPGFPTDLQAQMMAVLCLARGTSRLSETIFENRFQHVAELARMGADIRLDGGSACVRGGAPLRGAAVVATDLRASVSLVVAALAARGTTRLSCVHHLDRGYERLEEKLAGLGAAVERVERTSESARVRLGSRRGAEPQPAAAQAARPAARSTPLRRAQGLE